MERTYGEAVRAKYGHLSKQELENQLLQVSGLGECLRYIAKNPTQECLDHIEEIERKEEDLEWLLRRLN